MATALGEMPSVSAISAGVNPSSSSAATSRSAIGNARTRAAICSRWSDWMAESSGVGASSLTTAYGFNRADWSHIPGGSASGTALIRPDFPELKRWPFFWQQTEYVLGRGTTDYLLLVLAADHVLNQPAPR